MSLHEAILAAIDKLNDIMNEQGLWNAEEYMEMVKPLHEALLALAKNDPVAPS